MFSRLSRLAPFVVLAGCLALRPALAPSRMLAPGADDARPGAPKPFAVVFGGPVGPTVDPSEVTLVFNRPMRPLALVGEESSPPASIHARGTSVPPRGRWLWMGTSALVFSPEGRLPRATEYDVTVPGGTRALDGSTLPAAYAFSFSTPRPRFVRADPPRATHMAPTQTIELRFNQPVDPAEVLRTARLVVGRNDAVRVPFTVTRPDEAVLGLVKLTPKAPLPADSDILLAFDPSLRGMEGPLTADDDKWVVGWHTYGPLVVREVKCNHPDNVQTCDSRSSITVVLSNSVQRSELLRHVTVDGLPAVTWGKLHNDADADSDTDPDERQLSDAELAGELPPSSHHTVVVHAGLTDEFGQKLAADTTVALDSAPEPRDVAIGLVGQTLESLRAGVRRKAHHAVPIYSVSMPSFDVMTAAVDEREITALLVARDLSDDKDARSKFVARAFAMPGARFQAVHPSGKPDIEVAFDLPQKDLLADGHAAGASLLGVREAVAEPDDAQLLSVTDLAVTGKVSRFGDLFWVTRLSTGEPVQGATVTLRDREGKDLAATMTDAEGLAHLEGDPGGPEDHSGWRHDQRVLFVRAGDDWTFHAMWEPFHATAESERLPAGGGPSTEGTLFTDRGVYRPGETVHVKGLFRTRLPRGTATPPAGEPVEVKASIASQKVWSGSARLDVYGGFTVDVPLAGSVAVGWLEVEAKLGDDDEAVRAGARVADFEPAEFSVSVVAEDRPYVRGDTATFSVHADYLFGAPMAGAKLHWTATRSDTTFEPVGTAGLVSNDDAYRYVLAAREQDGRVASGEGLLDAHGVFGGTVALALPSALPTQRVTVEAEVVDASRKTIASRAGLFVHPGDFYLSLEPPEDPFVARGTKIHARVAGVEPGGRRREGVKVHLEALRVVWGVQKAHSTSVGSCDVTTREGDALAGCDLLLPAYGQYVVRATGRDAHGHDLASSFSAYVYGGSSVTPNKVAVMLDKKQYEIGDVARVSVASPWPEADALVTVERTGVYREERVAIHGGAGLVRVPITEDLWPNADVVVHVVRGRTADAPARGGPDPGRPEYRYAWERLSIDREAHTLSVAVKPDRKEHRPGEDVDVEVAVATRDGKPAAGSVTLWAVDEGTLMLTTYRTPRPQAAFAEDRPLAVFGFDTRDDRARVLAHRPLIGGGSGYGNGHGRLGGSSSARSDFRPTVFFESSLPLGADGRLHHRFKLPDGVTTYRIMAVAATLGDRFGSGESTVVTSLPLMLRASLPRFMRAGDTMQAGVLVTRKAGLAGATVDVSLDVTGVKLVGDPVRRGVMLPAGGTTEVTWPIEAMTGGTATFTWRATAGSDSDAAKATREVSVPTTIEAVALAGATTTAVVEQLGDLGNLRPDYGGLEVHLASTALVGLGAGVESLFKYPYGCTEQLASRLVPLVPLLRLATDFDLPLPEDVHRVIGETVDKIVRNQRADGSFGYWSNSETGDTWVTAYALWALSLARGDGAQVSAERIANAQRALKTYLGEAPWSGAPLVTKAFIVDVLAETGAPDVARMRDLFARRGDMPLEGRALLAHAMLVSKSDAAHAKDLVRDVEGHLRVTAVGATVADALGDAYAPILDSEARTTAIVLRALLAADRGSPLASRLAHGLLDVRRGGVWRTTQETAWALLALAEYRAVQEAAPPDFDALLRHGDDLLTKAPFHRRAAREVSLTLPMAELAGKPAAPFTFAVDGRGSLFYEARLRYARKTLPEESVDRGLAVRKVVRPVSADGLEEAVRSLALTGTTTATAGGLVLVDLFVTTPDPRESVVIDDPLPAGLAAAQSDFATTARSLDIGAKGDRADRDASHDDDRANGRAVNASWYRREVRDDRVLFFVEHMAAGFYHYRYLARAMTVGRFVVPPTQAECMYEPETFGRTGGSVFEVKTP